jgi:hypothetical protein
MVIGLLLLLGGGAVAGAQFAPIDVTTLPELNPVFDNLPGTREFLKSDMALYAGGGVAGFGLLLMIIGAATGGKKRERLVAKSPEMPAPQRATPTRTSAAPVPAPDQPAPPSAQPPETSQPPAAAPRPAPRIEPAPAVQKADAPAPPPVAPPPPGPVSPAPALAPAPDGQKAKPQASGQPPAGVAQPAASVAPPLNPSMLNRKRVQDLVTINDALKACFSRNGAYPKADGLAGANERGAGWIPGLSPEFLARLPLDPLHSADTQYVYASDGAGYKLLAQGVSLVGAGNVTVLGIRIDPTRNPTQQNAAFGFWTPAFAGV